MTRLWLFPLMVLMAARSTAATTKPGCRDTCGNVTVPYPFGIGSPDCALQKDLFLNCTQSADGSPLLLYSNINVTNISVPDGTLTIKLTAAFGCYNSSGSLGVNSISRRLQLRPSFTLSDTGNVFTVIGCDTSGVVRNSENTFGSSCLSLCRNRVELADDNPCAGSGCCKISVPQGIQNITLTVGSTNRHQNVSDFNPCGYAFVAEKNSLKLSDWPLSRPPPPEPRYYKSTALLEWVAEKGMCPAAETSICANKNTECHYSENAKGYRCSCKQGFGGNPYLEGCEDINECEDPQKYPCRQGKCHNVVGNYTCKCPLGMYGDGKTSCRGFTITTIAGVIGGIVAIIVISILVYVVCMRRRKDRNFRENGGIVLKHQRVRLFSEAELRKATMNYDNGQKLGEGGFGSVYEGLLADSTKIAVKKSKGMDKQGETSEDFQQELAIVSQVNHKNVVKLLGLCLETKVPLLVYEFISHGNLSEHIHDPNSHILQTWTNRLRIASEVALSLDYLHSLANPPIIHGDVKPVNILLDDKYTAKIADFGASVLISLEEPDIAKRVKGTFGYLDPEYLMTGNLTTRSDVYSFGVMLVELLTGEKPSSNRNIVHHLVSALESNRLPEVLGFQVANNSEMVEIEEVARLAKKCINGNGANRPTMKEVSEDLAKLMTQTDEHSWTNKKSQETERLLSDSPQRPLLDTAMASYTVMSMEMENYTDDSI